MIERDEGALAEAIDAFLKGTYPIGEDLRKHRQDDPRQIGAVSTKSRLDIHRITLLDEGGHVRDMDTKRPLPRSRIERDRYRIIEVTCIGWINREDDLLREILAVIGNTLPVGLPGECSR